MEGNVNDEISESRSQSHVNDHPLQLLLLLACCRCCNGPARTSERTSERVCQLDTEMHQIELGWYSCVLASFSAFPLTIQNPLPLDP